LAGAIGCGGGGGGGRAELEKQSIANMHELASAVWEYRDWKKKYPDELKGEDIEKLVGGREFYEQIMVNPITGDNPGYEYVKPPDDTPLSADPIIIYQLRNGQRDTSLKAYALDLTARSVEP
jgi:hypothetical protein